MVVDRRIILPTFQHRNAPTHLTPLNLQERDKIFRELINEWGLYKEDPQFLDAFGIRVPSEGFYQRKKKKDETPADNNSPAGELAAEEIKM